MLGGVGNVTIIAYGKYLVMSCLDAHIMGVVAVQKINVLSNGSRHATNVSSSMCGQRKPRSDRVSAQYDYDLHRPLTEPFDAKECINRELNARVRPAKTFLPAYADSEDPDQPAHPRSLLRTITVRTQNH